MRFTQTILPYDARVASVFHTFFGPRFQRGHFISVMLQKLHRPLKR